MRSKSKEWRGLKVKVGSVRQGWRGVYEYSKVRKGAECKERMERRVRKERKRVKDKKGWGVQRKDGKKC